MMEKLSQIYSPLAQLQSAINNISRALICALCSLLGVVISSVSYADGYRQVCTAPTTTCVLSGSVNSCTTTTHCNWVLDASPPSGWTPPPPAPNPNTGGGSMGSAPPLPPPPPKCDVIAAENALANDMCDRDAKQLKLNLEQNCSRVPAVAYKDISVGTDIGKIVTVNINGKVQEEYRPQEGCYRGATNTFDVKVADCVVKKSERNLAAVKLGCK